VQPEAEDEGPAPDLMAALEASLAEIRSGDSDKPAPTKKPSAKSTAKSSSKSNGSSTKTKSRAKAKS
jgi:hypothetical protein